MARRFSRAIFGCAFVLAGLTLPSAQAATPPDGPPPIITHVDSYDGHPRIHIDWGPHIDAPFGLIERAYGGGTSGTPSDTMVDYGSWIDQQMNSYRAIACYDRCDWENWEEGNSVLVVGPWWRPDVSDAIAQPGPEVSVAWDSQSRAFSISVDAGSHPNAAIIFLRDGQLYTGSRSDRFFRDWPGTPTATYSAIACYSDCGERAFRDGFSQMTQPGPSVTVTESSPPITTATTIWCAPYSWRVGDHVDCYLAVEGEQYFSTRPSGTLQISITPGTTVSTTSCTLSNGSCWISFDVTEDEARTTTLSVTYSGDQYHMPSSAERTFWVPYATTTSVSCSPMHTHPGGSTFCTARVVDETGAPVGAGTVDLHGGHPGSPGGCALASDGTCSAEYRFSQYAPVGESVPVRAHYMGTELYRASDSPWVEILMDPFPTFAHVWCTPSTIHLDESVSCRAWVDYGYSRVGASGYVTFSDAAESTQKACLLDSYSECVFTLTPTVTGTHTLTATYEGTSKYAPSGPAYSSFLVDARPTTTSMQCAPTSAAVGDVITCNVVVAGASSSTSHPTGRVEFTGDAVNPASCTLQPNGGCSIRLTTDYVGAGAREIHARYAGDAAHAESAGTIAITLARGSSMITSAPLVMDSSVYPGLRAKLESTTSHVPIWSVVLTFWSKGRLICSATTNADGYASCEGAEALTQGLEGYEVRFEGNDAYLPATGRWPT